jgi:predicted ATP-grasp superfamily ATP-dependent carboligase
MHDKRYDLMLLDGSNRQMLAIVRNMGRKRRRIVVGGPARLSRAFYSRYCHASFVYGKNSGGQCTDEELHEEIFANVLRYRPAVLMPGLCRTFSIVARYRDVYEKVCRVVPMETYERYLFVSDKWQLHRVAQKEGVPVCKTICPQNAELLFEAGNDLRYPVIIKPRLAAGGYNIVRAECPAELLRAYRSMIEQKQRLSPYVVYDNNRPIVQEYMTGEVYNYYGYAEKGVIGAYFMTATVSQFPTPFGPGVMAKSVYNDQIKMASERMIRSLSWTGLIGFQFIHCDGRFYCIDVNPRFWGTIENAFACGVDFAECMYRGAFKKRMIYQSDYVADKYFFWPLFGGILTELRKKSLLRTLYKVLCGGIKTDIDITDAIPHIMHGISAVLYKHCEL